MKNSKPTYEKSILAILIVFISPFSNADECPIPPTSVNPSITVKVEYDKKTKLYTYNYTFANGNDSKLPVGDFMLGIKDAPASFSSPSGKWVASFNSAIESLPRTFSWTTGSEDIRPGNKKSGFILRSYLAPHPIRYFVLGETGDRVGTPTAEDDEPIPDCSGFYDDAPGFDNHLSGIVDGPAPENQVSVDLKLMDNKGEHDCGPVSPYEDKGVLNVLLKVNRGTKVSDINLSSLRFGVGQAPLVSSKKIGHNEETILLQFDIQEVAIECGRDRVLFLSGKTTDGKDIFGGATVSTKNCEKRPKRKKPIHRKNPHGHREM